MKAVYGLVGASGFGSEVMPLLESKIYKSLDEDFECVFIDSDLSKREFESKRVLSEEEFFNLDAEKKFYNISISNPKIRGEVNQRFLKKDIMPISVLSNDLSMIVNVNYGVGAIILPHVLLTSNITIGNFFHSNPKCSIAHDVVIGDFVTLAPGVLVNGNVFIDDFAYIGSGSVIKQGITIGKGAIVGMGSVVIRDIEPGETVAGNPAKKI